MDENNMNMEIRKFLKIVGVTSQREIEKAIYSNLQSKKIELNSDINFTMTLTSDQLGHINEIKHKINLV